jgi:hypothetical protein
MVEEGDVKPGESTEKGSDLEKKEGRKKKKDERPSLINIWGIAGRHEIMEMRRLWQLRIPRK